MKAKRFSEDQIIGVLKEAEAGAKTKDRGRMGQEAQRCCARGTKRNRTGRVKLPVQSAACGLQADQDRQAKRS